MACEKGVRSNSLSGCLHLSALLMADLHSSLTSTPPHSQQMQHSHGGDFEQVRAVYIDGYLGEEGARSGGKEEAISNLKTLGQSNESDDGPQSGMNVSRYI